MIKNLIILTLTLFNVSLFAISVSSNSFKGPWTIYSIYNTEVEVFEDRDNLCYIATQNNIGNGKSDTIAISCLKKQNNYD